MTSTTLHNAILVSEIMRTADEPTDALELSNRSLFGAVTRELTHSPQAFQEKYSIFTRLRRDLSEGEGSEEDHRRGKRGREKARSALQRG